jgi:hypothetical protein
MCPFVEAALGPEKQGTREAPNSLSPAWFARRWTARSACVDYFPDTFSALPASPDLRILLSSI